MTEPVCLITGAGDGTGAATARRFTKGGYRVALLARTEERLKRLEKEISGSRGYVCDISDLDQLRNTVDAVRKDMACVAFQAPVRTLNHRVFPPPEHRAQIPQVMSIWIPTRPLP